MSLKNTPLVQTDEIPCYENRHYSFKFSEIGVYDKNEATDKLVKQVIRNMQWNKTKEAINASVQTNNDNPLL